MCFVRSLKDKGCNCALNAQSDLAAFGRSIEKWICIVSPDEAGLGCLGWLIISRASEKIFEKKAQSKASPFQPLNVDRFGHGVTNKPTLTLKIGAQELRS